MKYLITNHMNSEEKQEIKDKGLYCYDLRHSDDGTKIATIEKSVLVNRVGSIITNEELKFDDNDFIDFEKFSSENTEIDTIEEIIESKPRKAKFNTKIASEIKHNGEIVDIIDFSKGKDIYNDRYTVRFNDGTINNNIMPIELEFDFETNKVNKKNLKKEREAR